MKNKSRFLTIEEVAETLRVSQRTILRYIQGKRLMAAKIGQWRVDRNDLEDFIQKAKKI
ncbi:MAG: helix-turn-helix domain-containing protein [Patescibacteria group bacterium]